MFSPSLLEEISLSAFLLTLDGRGNYPDQPFPEIIVGPLILHLPGRLERNYSSKGEYFGSSIYFSQAYIRLDIILATILAYYAQPIDIEENLDYALYRRLYRGESIPRYQLLGQEKRLLGFDKVSDDGPEYTLRLAGLETTSRSFPTGLTIN